MTDRIGEPENWILDFLKGLLEKQLSEKWTTPLPHEILPKFPARRWLSPAHSLPLCLGPSAPASYLRVTLLLVYRCPTVLSNCWEYLSEFQEVSCHSFTKLCISSEGMRVTKPRTTFSSSNHQYMFVLKGWSTLPSWRSNFPILVRILKHHIWVYCTI